MILSDLRAMHDFTQDKVCLLTGIPYNTYRRYEYGDTFPKKEAIIALADLYNMLPGELFQLLVDEGQPGYPDVDSLRSELGKYRKWLARQKDT